MVLREHVGKFCQKRVRGTLGGCRGTLSLLDSGAANREQCKEISIVLNYLEEGGTREHYTKIVNVTMHAPTRHNLTDHGMHFPHFIERERASDRNRLRPQSSTCGLAPKE